MEALDEWCPLLWLQLAFVFAEDGLSATCLSGSTLLLKMPRALKSKTDDPNVVKKIVAEWSSCPSLNEAMDHEVT